MGEEGEGRGDEKTNETETSCTTQRLDKQRAVARGCLRRRATPTPFRHVRPTPLLPFPPTTAAHAMATIRQHVLLLHFLLLHELEQVKPELLPQHGLMGCKGSGRARQQTSE